jgi:NDP-sugar pyrophosphorylase family protein
MMDSLDHLHPAAVQLQSQETRSAAVTQAVIMAGGKGTRLYPYSALFPKPLMPLGDMPILELLLRRMRRAGVTDVTLAVNHLGHLIEAFFGNGSRLGLNIRYTNEDKPLGTAGALGNIIDELDETFIVSNGDLLTSMDLSAMARQHIETGCDASIGVFERENKIDFGLIEFDSEKRLRAYREKPSSMYYVSMGIYILQREAVRSCLVNGEYLDMPSLLLKMREANADVRCYHDGGMWLDIGRPDDFALAQSLFEQDRSLFLGS